MTIEQLLTAMYDGREVRFKGLKNLQGMYQKGKIFGIKKRTGLIWIEIGISSELVMIVPYGSGMFNEDS